MRVLGTIKVEYYFAHHPHTFQTQPLGKFWGLDQPARYLRPWVGVGQGVARSLSKSSWTHSVYVFNTMKMPGQKAGFPLHWMGQGETAG